MCLMVLDIMNYLFNRNTICESLPVSGVFGPIMSIVYIAYCNTSTSYQWSFDKLYLMWPFLHHRISENGKCCG